MKLLKWIFYLPIAIVASFILTAVINFSGQLLFGWFKFTSTMMCIAAGTFGASTLVLISQKIAPNYNRIVKISLFLTLIILGGIQVANFFYDFGYTGNMTLSKLTLRSAQSFIGIGLLLGLLMVNNDVQDGDSGISSTKNSNDDIDDDENKTIRGTIGNLEQFINHIKNKEDILSIMFNDSSDFINITKDGKYLIVSYPIVTDRMNRKKNIFKLDVKTFKGVVKSENETIITVEFWNGNIGGLKAVLNSTFKLNEDSFLDYQIDK